MSAANVVLELTNCDAGQYVSSAFVCAACPAGRYSSLPGATACMSCGSGLVSNVKSIGCVAACPSGQYNDSGAQEYSGNAFCLLFGFFKNKHYRRVSSSRSHFNV
jgi:hypothetical protein